MASDVWGVLRTVGLVMLIGFAFACEAILLFQGQFWWATFWGIAVIGGVILWEALSYWNAKKTISTRWKEWAKAQPFWAYTALACMALAFIGLILHLAVWGGMFS